MEDDEQIATSNATRLLNSGFAASSTCSSMSEPEHQPKLFEAFSQLHEPGLRRAEGTGLGLHLSHKLAAMMSGCIHFKSEHGRGSEFTVAIPKC
jgi:signal transduction histidine kinase